MRFCLFDSLIMTLFHEVLVNALTPIALISGVGMVMLCMVNRYNHCTDRIRQLIKDRSTEGLIEEPTIDREIHLVFRRASLLRRALLSMALSAASAGCLVATGAIGSFFNIDLLVPAALSLIASVGLIVLATLFYALEVRLSLHALSLAITDLKSQRERKDPSSC